MFYFGIDQHARQLTNSLRDDRGDVLQARQVSTQPEKLEEFFERLIRDFLQVRELIELATRYGRYGYRRITQLLRDFG